MMMMIDDDVVQKESIQCPQGGPASAARSPQGAVMVPSWCRKGPSWSDFVFHWLHFSDSGGVSGVGSDESDQMSDSKIRI